MILVTGSVKSKAAEIDRILELSLEHVHRSRQEQGCLLHSVHRDVEDPLHVVFIEHWADADALHAHFRVPASREFAKRLADLAGTPPEMTVFNAEVVS